jgi:hypothetical protein
LTATADPFRDACSPPAVEDPNCGCRQVETFFAGDGEFCCCPSVIDQGLYGLMGWVCG